MKLKTNAFVNGRFLTFSFVITNLIYFVMILWSLPTLVEFSGGLAVFDMRPTGYTFSEAGQLLSHLGSEGINFYKDVQLRLDIIYPLGFILTYSIGCLWIFRKINYWRVLGAIGAVASVLAGVADYCENVFIFNMLNTYPNISEGVVAYSNLATVIKSISTTVAMSLFMLGFILLGLFTFKKSKMN